MKSSGQNECLIFSICQHLVYPSNWYSKSVKIWSNSYLYLFYHNFNTLWKFWKSKRQTPTSATEDPGIDSLWTVRKEKLKKVSKLLSLKREDSSTCCHRQIQLKTFLRKVFNWNFGLFKTWERSLKWLASEELEK